MDKIYLFYVIEINMHIDLGSKYNNLMQDYSYQNTPTTILYFFVRVKRLVKELFKAELLMGFRVILLIDHQLQALQILQCLAYVQFHFSKKCAFVWVDLNCGRYIAQHQYETTLSLRRALQQGIRIKCDNKIYQVFFIFNTKELSVNGKELLAFSWIWMVWFDVVLQG